MLDMGRCIPPVSALPTSHRRALQRELAAIEADGRLFSREESDLAASHWLRIDQWGINLDARRILHCASVKDAIDAIFRFFGPTLPAIACEGVTFGGFLRACERAGVTAIGVRVDQDGMTADALEAVLAAGQTRALYVIPNKQNPTNISMTWARKLEIVAVARRHDAIIIEDDIFAHFSDPSSPIAALAPERTFYLAGTSKALGMQPKQAWLLTPSCFGAEQRDVSETQARFCALARSGVLGEIVDWLKEEALARFALARQILAASGTEVRCAPGLHLWLPTTHVRAARHFERAGARGILLTDTRGIRTARGGSGTRICLGAPASREELIAAMETLATLLKD
jgi:DNA-binding transcriptional MocR family regulator